MGLAKSESVVLTAGLVSVVLASLTTMFLVSIEIPDSNKVGKTFLGYEAIKNSYNFTQGLPLETNLHYFERELQKQLNLYEISTNSFTPISSWIGKFLIGITVFFGLESLLLIVGVKAQVV